MIARLAAVAVLLARVASAAVAFDGTSNGTAAGDGGNQATPTTMCAWLKATLSGRYSFGLTDPTSGNDYYYGRNSADALSRSAAGTTTVTSSPGVHAADTWEHVCAVFDSGGNQYVYLNGANKVSSGAARNPSGSSRLALAHLARATPDNFSAITIAEFGLWHAVLTDEQVAVLAKGYTPPCVAVSSLYFYAPLVVRDATTRNRITNATVSGSVSPSPPTSLALGTGSSTSTDNHAPVHGCQ
jgi:hypothetical protein